MEATKAEYKKAVTAADEAMADPLFRCAVWEWLFSHAQKHVTETFHATPCEAFGPSTFVVTMTKVSNDEPGVEIASSGKTITLDRAAKRNVNLKVPALAEGGRGGVLLKMAFLQLQGPTDADRERLPLAVAKPKPEYASGSGRVPATKVEPVVL